MLAVLNEEQNIQTTLKLHKVTNKPELYLVKAKLTITNKTLKHLTETTLIERGQVTS